MMELDLDNNPSHVYEARENILLFHTYEDMLYPGQENVFRRLAAGQEVRVKGKDDVFKVQDISHDMLPGEDSCEIRLTLVRE